MNEYIISEPFTVTRSFERKITLFKEWHEGTEQNLERIVRCRDCKHYEYMGITQGWINVCTRGGHMMLVTSDGFCAWGEPKDATR